MDGPGKLVGERTILLNERISPGHPMDEEKLSATRRVMSNLHLEYPGDKFIITIEDNKGELIGVIMLAEATDEVLGKSKGVIDLLEIYGNLASIAINNARLFEMEIAARGEVETLNDLMTHDINNFIQGVLGYLDMIGNDKSASEMHRKYARRAIEQIEGTKRLIENVRKLAWIKTGFPEKMSSYDLGKVIGESLTHVMGTYPKKNVNFSSTIDTDQFFVLGDEMIQELFINLISNSVKFTPSQEVPIELSIKTQVEIGKEFWRIELVDHGRGIPEDKKRFVFERFGKQDYTPYGFGLGLSICRNLARKYGGRIWVEDRVPEDYRKGSKFVILLPKLIPEPSEEKPAAGREAPKKRVVRKIKESGSKGTSFSRVLKQPRPGRSEAEKAS
jgi:signal transduction histidine kinase